MKSVPIFLINLDRSADRLARCSQSLSELGLEWERVPAVDGSQLDPDWLSRLNPHPAPHGEWFRRLTAGELGCFLSHLRCWQLIVERDLDCALILEDDFAPEPILSASNLALLGKNPENWDLVKLSRLGKYAKPCLRLSDEIELCHWGQGPVDGTAYLVSRRGAAKLVVQREHIYRPVDFDFKHWWERDLELLAAQPDFFRQRSHEEAASIIGGRSDYRRYPLCRKLKVYLSKWCYHLRFLLAKQLGIGRRRLL